MCSRNKNETKMSYNKKFISALFFLVQLFSCEKIMGINIAHEETNQDQNRFQFINHWTLRLSDVRCVSIISSCIDASHTVYFTFHICPIIF